MKIFETIKHAPQNVFWSQEEFATELKISVCMVNCWEMGAVRVNDTVMKHTKVFCELHGIDFTEIKIPLHSNTEEQ